MHYIKISIELRDARKKIKIVSKQLILAPIIFLYFFKKNLCRIEPNALLSNWKFDNTTGCHR